jgi:hypothetical protein
MEGFITVIIAVSCLGAYALVYRYFKAPFFIFLSLALFFLSCYAITSYFHVPAYPEAAADTSMALAGALFVSTALQLKYMFKIAGVGI